MFKLILRKLPMNSQDILIIFLLVIIAISLIQKIQRRTNQANRQNKLKQMQRHAWRLASTHRVHRCFDRYIRHQRRRKQASIMSNSVLIFVHSAIVYAALGSSQTLQSQTSRTFRRSLSILDPNQILRIANRLENIDQPV